MTGVVFDIKEFALYDGPGIRTTVFMKGCPLRCQWCHNPEGLTVKRELMVSPSACRHCGRCQTACPTPGNCTACGKCVAYCPGGLRRMVGTEWTPADLAARLNKGRTLLIQGGGGVTFSGGEPLMQWPFVKETIRLLDGLHTAIETSGYTTDEIFRDVMSSVSLVMMDLKAIDPDVHRRYTGVDNAAILRHAQMLRDGDTPFIIRIPVIPGVNDNAAHYEGVAALLRGASALQRVELLPYHQTAGAKYPMVGKDYQVDFDPTRPPVLDTSAFEAAGIPAIIL